MDKIISFLKTTDINIDTIIIIDKLKNILENYKVTLKYISNVDHNVYDRILNLIRIFNDNGIEINNGK